MAHKPKEPEGRHDSSPNAVDVKAARRALAWVNAAKRPEDLMRPPDIVTHLHVEYRRPGFPERHPPVEEPHDAHERISQADAKLAIEVMKRRDEKPRLRLPAHQGPR